ncbi:MAG: hypothetical protein WDN23_02890 [Edaphobacter sp.]
MNIVTLSYVVLALSLGYVVTVALTMAATFGMTAASPTFAAKDHRIRRSYKYAQDAIWLLCTTAGGYAASLINGQAYSWIVAPSLSAILIAILWVNAWEMRQRGLGHQIVMSLAAIAGVTTGFFLHLH